MAKTTQRAARKATATAIDVFIDRKFEIDRLLARLVAASEDHFGRHPDAVNWGDAGSLGYVLDKLKEAAEFIRA